MGRIKTQLIKRLTLQIYRNHEDALTDDFDKNKEIIAKYANFTSRKMRNVVAGYVTRLVKKGDE